MSKEIKREPSGYIPKPEFDCNDKTEPEPKRAETKPKRAELKMKPPMPTSQSSFPKLRHPVSIN